jgi:sterol desaturase/sphingolipid hydroxylase (fatty acid hydroxylase superfamily)
MITIPEIVVLVVVAMLGHVLALAWLLAGNSGLNLCRCTIYQLPVPGRQLKRELRNSLYAPLPAVMLLFCLVVGEFRGTGPVSFVLSLLLTAVCAEIWHYFSHRALHTRPLLWIHREHHKSVLPSPFTAISFSFPEKLIFNLGILGALSAIDSFVRLNFYGIAGWYISYLFINSYGHANFEIKSSRFLNGMGRVLSSTTYHSMHHARYTGNYGLGTRILDWIFGTEWDDYEKVFEQVAGQKKPMRRLKESPGSSH